MSCKDGHSQEFHGEQEEQDDYLPKDTHLSKQIYPQVVESQEIFASIFQAGAIHLIGALPQLQSFNELGCTVYALTVFGITLNSFGASSLAGPAISMEGVTSDWPREAQFAAIKLFKKPSRRKAGTVVVVMINQIGAETHCALLHIPKKTAH